MSAYLNFNNRRGGKNTVTIDGVEYYQSQSYGIPSYYHLNERPKGGKKSQMVSDVLDVAIPKLAKYGLSAAALAAPILAGNPEFVPATMLLASDLHEPLGKKLRKTIKEKTGYGVYHSRGKPVVSPIMDDDDENEDTIPMKDLVKKKPVKKINRKKLVNKNITVEEMAFPVVKKAPVKKATVKKAVDVVAKKAEPAVVKSMPVKKAPAKKAPAKKPLPAALKKWQNDVKAYSAANNMPYGHAMVALSEERKNCGSADACYAKAKKVKKCKC